MAPNTSLDRLSCICGGNGVHESATAVGPMLGLVRRLGDLIGPGFSLSAWALAEGFGEPGAPILTADTAEKSAS